MSRRRSCGVMGVGAAEEKGPSWAVAATTKEGRGGGETLPLHVPAAGGHGQARSRLHADGTPSH